MLRILTEYKVWSTPYIIYFILSYLLPILAVILIKKYVKDEKALTWIARGFGLMLFIAIITNRTAVCIDRIIIKQDPSYDWRYFFPNSVCALNSLIFSLLLMFAKKDNIIFHFSVYVGLYGPIITSFYPSFLERQSFYELQSITGLLHHTLMFLSAIYLLATKRFKPSIKRWYVYPLIYSIFMVFGIFELQILNHKDAMQLTEPLLHQLPILTSWWMFGILASLCIIIFLFIYEHFKNEKDLKSIFYEFTFQYQKLTYVNKNKVVKEKK